MSRLKQILSQLHNNLNTLREREAKYADNAPLDLLNQITDHKRAITLTEKAIADDLTEAEWREATKPLLLALDRGKVINIEAETYVAGDQHIHQAPEPSPGPPNTRFWRWLVTAGIVVALVAGLIAIVNDSLGIRNQLFPPPTTTPTPTATLEPTSIPTPTPISPMSDNFFNIGVAFFPEIDSTGHLSMTQASQEFTDFLVQVVEDTSKQPGLAAKVRRPELIGLIPEIGYGARAQQASKIAADHNANFLLFGVIWRKNGVYQAELEFYVSHQGFSHAGEIVGSDRLGQPISFNFPLDSPTVQDQLSSRVKILQHLIEGLHHFYFNNQKQAKLNFENALIVIDPEPFSSVGLEVIHLLIGSTILQDYGPMLPVEDKHKLLNEAEVEFLYANELNQKYARPYLGLGIVAFQQATMDWPPDKVKLLEAEQWYIRSLTVPDQPNSAYIPIKATFGLGQTYLAGYHANPPEWPIQQAKLSFEKVIANYNQNKNQELAPLAGHSHYYLGWIHGDVGDWNSMADEIYTAITILNGMQGHRLKDWIAFYWAQAAIAEEQVGNKMAARNAYDQALSIAKQVSQTQSRAFTQKDLDDWQAKLDELSN